MFPFCMYWIVFFCFKIIVSSQSKPVKTESNQDKKGVKSGKYSNLDDSIFMKDPRKRYNLRKRK